MNPLPSLSDASLDAAMTREQWCVLYLLGELNAEQSAALEQQLAASPVLSDQLAQLAETMVAVAGVPAASAVPSPVAPSAAMRSRWPQLAAVLAIAASLLLIWAGIRFADTPATTTSRSIQPAAPAIAAEDLLIAQAWADSLSAQDSEDASLIDLDPDDALASTLNDDTPEIDSALSWMVIAVAADLDLQLPETRHGS